MSSVATIGHNSQNLSPFEESEAEIVSLSEEAQHWLDGEPVTTQGQCDALAKLMDHLRKAGKKADERRTEENKPFDDGKAAVQAKYAPLIADTKAVKGKVPLAIDACKKAMQPFLIAEEEKKRAAAEAARREAEERQASAQAAMRASVQAEQADLRQREEAERLVREAKQAEQAAKAAEKDRAQAKGGARAATLRTSYSAEVTDMQAFMRWVWKQRHEEMSDWASRLAQQTVAAGFRDIPGVTVHELRSVV